MSAAMAANNIEKAVSYYWVPMQAEWKRRIASFSDDQRTQLGRDFITAELRINRVEGGRADCYLTIPRDGKRVSGQLIFVQGIDGEWLIETY